MRKSGINLEQVKKENRSLIIKCINDNGPTSRKDIAEKTGLTAASVTQITTQLIADNILYELGSVAENTGLAGRKKVLLDLNPKYAYVLSVNIESEITTIAICDIKGNILSGEKDVFLLQFNTKEKSHSPENFLDDIADKCNKLIDLLSKEEKQLLKCVSVGIPGIVDKENGLAVHAYGIWDEEVAVKAVLEKNIKGNIPVMLENNVNAFATAEVLLGYGREYDSLLLIKWGPGVGSTIVIDGKVYEGRHGKTAELGHLIVKPGGKKCSCGRRGCLETIISHKALSQLLDFDPDYLSDAIASAPLSVQENFGSYIDNFATSIINTCTIIAPNRIILSGYLFHDVKIRNMVVNACKKYDKSYNSNRIRYTKLYEKENYIGPVAAYIKRCLSL